MEPPRPLSLPLMRVAPMFFKEKSFWEKELTDDEFIRDIGSIDNIDYNPFNLDELLISSLARVTMYDSNSLEPLRTFKTHTQYQVYGGCFRKNDGRLLAAGSEEGKVFIFESQNTNPLRTFELKAPTHRVLFYDNKLVSFSDDLAVRILDVGSGNVERTYGDKPANTKTSRFHKDYVRCGCVMDRLIASGSYDNTIKLWDPRIDDLNPVIEFDHGYSVESLTTRGETLLISVGGNKLQVFDMIAGKTLTNVIPRHHKTITSVANYEDKFLLTGSLDGYLNVLDFNYEYITRFNYDEAQILSVAVNPKLLAVGFNNHRTSIKRFKDFIKKSHNEAAELERLQSSYFGPNTVTRYFQEAITESQDPSLVHKAMLAIKQKKKPIVLSDVESLYRPIVIPKRKSSYLSRRPKFERHLAGFRHTMALEEALREREKDPDSVIYVLFELMKRDKLRNAILKSQELATLVEFINKHLSEIHLNRILLDSATVLINLLLSDRSLMQRYDDHRGFAAGLETMVKTVDQELQVIDSCTAVAAQLNTVISHY